MKRSVKPFEKQLNLLLLGDTPVAAVVAGDKQKELTIALMELLIHAAQEGLETQPGGNNESSKAHA
jgi:hypothetical protein